MSVSTQKELNILIATPQVPELSTADHSLKNKLTVQESSIQDNHVYEINPRLKDIESSMNTTETSAKQAQIRWTPQVSSSCALFFSKCHFMYVNLDKFPNTHFH
jgi:hypothetical protein